MKHQEIIELLPWYANATLSEDERRTVETHVAGCKECAQELTSLAAMRKAVVALADEAPAPSPHLLNRALAEIEDYERGRAQKSARMGRWRRQISEFWAGLWPSAPVFARAALAAQLALVLVLGTVAVYQHKHPQIVYKVSTGPSGEGTGARISVVFNENASEREIRQALEEIHGTIVEGPTAEGSYTVQLPIRPEQTAELEKNLETLRQHQRVVRFAVEKQ
jgi:hypothetical protein